MRGRGVKARIYHSFFRWCGQNDWTPERMGQKYVPRVIIWDEVCTLPKPILETFLGWLEQKGLQVICCGDQGQPPPIAGEMPQNWLQQRVDNYEEVEVDHTAKNEALKTLKRTIRLKPDRFQCQEMRKALPECLGWDRFAEQWRPGDLILTNGQKVRNKAQELLFQRHKEHFPGTPVPLLYHPKDSRKQNIMVTIPGTNNREELVLNDVVDVSFEAAGQAFKTDANLQSTPHRRSGSSMTITSGPTWHTWPFSG